MLVFLIPNGKQGSVVSGNGTSANTEDVTAAQPGRPTNGTPIAPVCLGSYGELRRRLAGSPLNFTFNWHGIEFAGRFDASKNGIALALRGQFGSLPYSAEDSAARSELIGVIEASPDVPAGRLKVVCGRKTVLDTTIDLPRVKGNTASEIVACLAVMVLRAAPYLELIAGSAPPAARRARAT